MNVGQIGVTNAVIPQQTAFKGEDSQTATKSASSGNGLAVFLGLTTVAASVIAGMAIRKSGKISKELEALKNVAAGAAQTAGAGAKPAEGAVAKVESLSKEEVAKLKGSIESALSKESSDERVMETINKQSADAEAIEKRYTDGHNAREKEITDAFIYHNPTIKGRMVAGKSLDGREYLIEFTRKGEPKFAVNEEGTILKDKEAIIQFMEKSNIQVQTKSGQVKSFVSEATKKAKADAAAQGQNEITEFYSNK